MTSSFGKLLGTFPPKRLVEIKYKKSTGSQTDGTFTFFPKYLQNSSWYVFLYLFSHILNILCFQEFETAWCLVSS